MKPFILIAMCISLFWYSTSSGHKETQEDLQDMIEESCEEEVLEEVYAGRYDNQKSGYTIMGLPSNRKWLTCAEWRGDHIQDSSLRVRSNFSKWKESHKIQFIKSWAIYANTEQKATGVPASIIIAQAILESNWGLSRLAVEANNYFGHKYRGTNKNFIVAADDTPNDKFSKYNSVWWSIRNHSNILCGMYKGRLKGNKLNDWLEALCGGMSIETSRRFVKNGGMVYATSCYKGTECYSKKLKRIINYYKLYKYDVNANQKTMGKPKQRLQ